MKHVHYLAATACLIAGAYMIMKRKRRRRRWNVRPKYRERKTMGDWYTRVPKMRLSDPEMHFEHFSMDSTRFDKLVTLIGARIARPSFSEGLSAGERLAITLRYLAGGLSMTAITFEYLVAKSTISALLGEVCDAIWEELQPMYMPKATSVHWQRVAEGYDEVRNLPNCVGALEGRQIIMKAAPLRGSAQFHREHPSGMILLAACDAQCRFTLAEVSCKGDGILKNSSLGRKLMENTMGLPSPKIIPKTKLPLPYYFVSDLALPLKENLMRPFSGAELDEKCKVFNYRLSRVSSTIENALGIMCSRWRMLLSPIHAQPVNVEKFVKAACMLHNYSMLEELGLPESERLYCPPGYADCEDVRGNVLLGDWRVAIPESCLEALEPNDDDGDKCDVAESNRLNLADYFVSPEGSLPWQLNYV